MSWKNVHLLVDYNSILAVSWLVWRLQPELDGGLHGNLNLNLYMQTLAQHFQYLPDMIYSATAQPVLLTQ